MCSVAPLAHYGFEVIPRMSTPQMMALDQALAEIEVAPARSRRWAWQLSGMPRQMRAAIGRHRDIIRLRPASFPGGGRALRCHESVLATMRAGGLPDSRPLLIASTGTPPCREPSGVRVPSDWKASDSSRRNRVTGTPS